MARLARVSSLGTCLAKARRTTQPEGDSTEKCCVICRKSREDGDPAHNVDPRLLAKLAS
jgi:hypothetical protein